jgi:hypothetical protein
LAATRVAGGGGFTRVSGGVLLPPNKPDTKELNEPEDRVGSAGAGAAAAAGTFCATGALGAAEDILLGAAK